MKSKMSRGSYSPDRGLVTVPTVKEWIAALLKEGYFDKAKTCVLAVSNDECIAWSSQGQEYEAMTLGHYLQVNLDRQYIKHEK